jgi:hypothetical protein
MNICNEIQVLTAVNVKVTFYLDDGGGKFLRNTGAYLLNKEASLVPVLQHCQNLYGVEL